MGPETATGAKAFQDMTMTTTPAPDDPVWQDIRARYEAGAESVQSIAEGIGLNRFALSLHALKQGWAMRGRKKSKAAPPATGAKAESTRDTILRLKTLLQSRVTQLEQELKDIDAIGNERGIRALGLLVRTIEKVLDLERKDKLKRKQAAREFKYFDDEQRRQLAEKIERLEAQRNGGLVERDAGAGGGGGTEQPVALLGEAGPATAAGGP
jgi:hypothetical protein